MGTIFFSFLTTIVASLNLFHPYALVWPPGWSGHPDGQCDGESGADLSGYGGGTVGPASTSETISGITGIYVAIFVGIPLTKKLYQLLEPPIAKLRREPSEVLESRKKQENMEADETEERKGTVDAVRRVGNLLVISGLGIALANFIGFDVGFMDSLPGSWCCWGFRRQRW